MIGIVSIFVGFSRHHTPNFGWGNVISPDALVNSTHWDLFWNTLIPVFRPSLHIEKILLSEFGHHGISIYNSLIWWIGFLIYLCFIFHYTVKVLISEQTRTIVVTCLINLGLLLYSLFFSYGSFVDILYPIAVSCLSLSAIHRKRSHSGAKLYLSLIGISACVFIADNSRPFFLYVWPIFVLISVIQRRLIITCALVLGAILTAPYHVGQFMNTGSITMSSYAGCNVAEVFFVPGASPIIGYVPDNINTSEVAEYCTHRLFDIKKYILDSPVSAVNDVLTMPRPLWIVMPPPFVPGVPDSEVQVWRLVVWSLLIGLLYVPLFFSGFFQVVRAVKNKDLDVILVYVAIFLPAVFAFIAHGGWESGRVQMAFFYPLTLISLSLFAEPIQKEATLP